MGKESILNNFKFVVLFQTNKNFTYLKDEAEVNRWIADGSIQDGDIVVALNEDNIRLATKVSYTELK